MSYHSFDIRAPKVKLSLQATLVAATLIPFVLLPLWDWLDPTDAWRQADYAKVLLLFSTGHVGATLFFYLDKGATSYRKNRPWTFLIIPFLLCVSLGLISTLFPAQTFAFFMSVHIAILFFHYQRQNFGIILLINGGLQQSARQILHLLLLLPVIPAVIIWASRLGLFSLGEIGSHLLPGYWIAFCLVVSAVALVILRKSLSVKGVLAAAIGLNFFAPFFFYPDNLIVAFTAFATAHGAQYLSIMGFMALGVGQLRFLRVLCACILFGVLFLGAALPGVVVALTWTHFLIDARIWRMKNPESRTYVMSRLGKFLKPS